MGERTPLALLDAPASGRMAVGEAMTNLAAADVGDIGRIKLSANWMAAAGHGGEDAALFDTVKAVGIEFCPALGVAIPVGKDSLSMRTKWEEGGEKKQVTAPLSLIVTAFAAVRRRAPHADAATAARCRGRRNRAAADRPRPGPQPPRRLGAGPGVRGSVGEHAPDADAACSKTSSAQSRTECRDGLLLAYHDRSDGGLFATVCEMSFASHVGVSLNLDGLCYDPLMNDVDGSERFPQIAGRLRDRVMGALFAEELGAVLQIRRGSRCRDADIARCRPRRL
jgi:phosphoribosylformylglycinamidine synthase